MQLLGFLVFIALSVHFVACLPSCNTEDLKQCVQDLNGVTNNHGISYGENERELGEKCRILEGAMQCANTFTRRCMDYSQQQMFREIMRGPQSMIDDLCTEGSDFRNEYLRNAGCFKNTTEDFRTCYFSFKRKEEIIKSSPLSPIRRLRKTCCIFNDYKYCTRQFLLEKCNTEAADFADRMVTKAGGSLVQSHCAPYSFSPGDC